MTHTPDTPEQRDDKASALADEQIVRAKDLRRFKWETRGAYVVAIGVAVYVAIVAGQVQDVSRDQIDGRRLGSQVTCAFGGAVSEAGRGVILASAPGPEVVKRWTPRQRRFERNLVALGYPPLSERRVAARIGGAAYVENIARQVEEATGIRGLVIKKGRDAGKLDCDKLQEAAAIGVDG